MIQLAHHFNSMDTLQYARDILCHSKLVLFNCSSHDTEPREQMKHANTLKEGHPFREVLIREMTRGRHQLERERLIRALYEGEDLQAEKVQEAKRSRKDYVEKRAMVS